MNLTPQRKRCVEQLLEGKSNKEIGESLGIATRTVKSQLDQLYLAMGISGHDRNLRVALAVKIHNERHILGVRCKACGEC